MPARVGAADAESAIVVLVDGLGYWNPRHAPRPTAPYLRSLMNESANQRPIATCAPGTTVAAMAAFGTGTCPGLTAMAGYTQLEPASHKLHPTHPVQRRAGTQNQPIRTFLCRPWSIRRSTCSARRRCSRNFAALRGARHELGLPKFSKSPLTGSRICEAPTIKATSPPSRSCAGCRTRLPHPGLTYLYIRGRRQSRPQLRVGFRTLGGRISNIYDASLALLKRSAPKGTLIVIVADHGMLVQTDMDQRIDIAVEPQLTRGVSLVGEPRSLMLYAEPDERPGEDIRRWRDCRKTEPWVRTKDEAIEDGLFGPVCERVRPMLGDVVVRGSGAVTPRRFAYARETKATHLPSVHGSQTALKWIFPA